MRVKIFRMMGMGRADVDSAVRRSAKNDREIDQAARHVPDIPCVVCDLVESDKGEAPCHKFDNWTEAEHGGADTETGKAGFADRSVDHPLGAEALKEIPCDFVGALIFGNFLAHEEDLFVALHFFSNGLVDSFAVSYFLHETNESKGGSPALFFSGR